MKAWLLVSTALTALAAGSALAGPQPTGPGAHPYHFPATKLLYNQNSNYGQAITSQNFTGGSSTTYNAAAADDFVVPAGEKWNITNVDVAGAYIQGPGPAASEAVTFYDDGKGLPGRTKASYTLNCTDTRGSFACLIPGPHGKGLALSGGAGGKRFWLSVVANLDFCCGNGWGEWGWTENTKIRHSQGMWENPWNGFGTGCKTWGTNGNCLGFPGDYAFDLRGSKL